MSIEFWNSKWFINFLLLTTCYEGLKKGDNISVPFWNPDEIREHFYNLQGTEG